MQYELNDQYPQDDMQYELNDQYPQGDISFKISINKSNQKNSLTKWETLEAKSYEELVKSIKKYPYSSAQFDDKPRNIDNVQRFNNMLIYDIDNDPKDEKLTIKEAEALLKSKNISAIILPSKSHQIEKFTSSGKSKGVVDRYRILVPLQTAITNLDKETYKEFNQITCKALGLNKYVDTKALSDKARFYYPSPLKAEPTIITSKKIMNISNLEERAIENVKQIHATKKEHELKIQEIKKNINTYTKAPSSSGKYLTYVDAQELIEMPILAIISKFEKIDITQEGSYTYAKSDNTKYSIIDDNVAHDFKNDCTFNSLTYLQMQYKTENLNTIALELEKDTNLSYVKTNFIEIEKAVKDALMSSTNDKTFEKKLKNYFNCKYCKLEKNSITIADKKIALSEINISKKEIIDNLRKNRKDIALER